MSPVEGDEAAGAAVDVLTFGEALASLRSTGPLVPGSTLSVSPVGAELNVAIGLARLGHRAQWIGRVGDDVLGELAVRALRAEGVRTAALVDPSRLTASMVVVDRRPLALEVLYYRADSAGSQVAPDDVLPAIERRPRLLHVTGVTPALSATAAAAVEAAVRRAEELGIPISLDVNHRAKLWSAQRASDVLTPLAARATVVVASQEELALVAPGTDSSGRAAVLRDAGVQTVVVKLGRQGAESFGPEGHRRQEAYAVTEVDSIGAGDAFSAGYLSAYLDGVDEQGRLDRGCRAGAFAVSARGDWERSPTRREIGLLGSATTEPGR
jgi:2-dehydro-3-deoxygluconokinase